MNTNTQIIALEDSALDLVAGGASLANANVSADASVKAHAGLSLGEGGLNLNVDAALSLVAKVGLGLLG